MTETVFPMAKVNLGLNVVERRTDGYHNLQTVFYPVPIADRLEVSTIDNAVDGEACCQLTLSGIELDGDSQQNLAVRAYDRLQQLFPGRLPALRVHLHKTIPVQAGMGGGSSDGTAMLCLLNRQFALGLTNEQLVQLAASLGADCPFFVQATPAYAEGIGEKLTPIALSLSGWYMAVVRPPVSVSTREAFALVKPRQPQHNCRDVVLQPVETWKDLLTNDFEDSVFPQYPIIAQVKDQLNRLGAVYAAMSGSGSALFGLFRDCIDVKRHFPGMFATVVALK